MSRAIRYLAPILLVVPILISAHAQSMADETRRPASEASPLRSAAVPVDRPEQVPVVGLRSRDFQQGTATAFPTPQVDCPTPTPGPSPTSPAVIGNLAISALGIVPEPCRTNALCGGELGLFVGIRAGQAMGPFIVEVNDQFVAHGPMYWTQESYVWVPGYRADLNTVLLDIGEQSGDCCPEDNRISVSLPVPPLPLPLPTCPAPSPDPQGPDLAVTTLHYAFPPFWSCPDPMNYGLGVDVANHGGTATGPFIVDANGALKALGGIAAGGRGYLWYEQPPSGENVVVVDAYHEVVERDESNNTYTGPPQIPSSVPPCPDTPTPSPTSTSPEPAATASGTPDGTESQRRLWLPVLAKDPRD